MHILSTSTYNPEFFRALKNSPPCVFNHTDTQLTPSYRLSKVIRLEASVGLFVPSTLNQTVPKSLQRFDYYVSFPPHHLQP